MDIKIKNFQSIGEAEISAEKLTVIVGPSDRGKSAFIRAIKAGLLNARGNDYVKYGEDSSVVEIADQDFSLKWEKGAKVSGYVELTTDGGTEEYKKLGNSMPEEVQKVTGIREVPVGDLTLTPQIQPQHDYQFLLDKTDTQISTAISHLAKTERILAASKLCASDLRETKSKLKHKKEDLEDHEGKLDRVAEPFGRVATVEEELSKQHTELNTGIQEITLIHQFIEANNLHILYEEGISKIVEPEDVSLEDSLDILSLIEDYIGAVSVESLELPEDLDSLGDIDSTFSDISLIEEYIDVQGILDTEIPETPEVDSLDNGFETLSLIEDCLHVVKDIYGVKDDLSENSGSIDTILNEIADLEKELGVCPTCGQGFENHGEH
jgi:DNA repair exonuclease SbcCD ATPase subunit